jgi:hypothetical protein
MTVVHGELLQLFEVSKDTILLLGLLPRDTLGSGWTLKEVVGRSKAVDLDWGLGV